MHFHLWASVVTWAALVSSTLAASVCNGHSEFCSRSYSNVSIIGTHNSYGVSAGNVAANQNYSVTTQLNNGIRLLQVQGHMNNGSLHLCHTSCFLLDAGTLTSYLTLVKTWLDANPNEVLTLVLVNSDAIAPSTWAASYAASGMDHYSYTPSSVPIAYDGWPTYNSLIASGKRAISFLAQNADFEAVPYLIDEFTHVWETPYDVSRRTTTRSDFYVCHALADDRELLSQKETSTSFPCTVDRVTGSYSNKMYMMNHFLGRNVSLLGETFTVPATSSLNQTNAATGTGSLGAQASSCFSQYKYYPTFTLVDYYDVGNGSVFQYAAKLNGVSYTATQIGNSSSTAANGGQTSAPSNPNTDGTVVSTPLSGARKVAVGGAMAIACVVVGMTVLLGLV
ncbi:BZ3500_MvSof-1268-A1-R1_Chr7-1g09041 [Microbotryum saponariae]|uniref:BZ3500_MvSof-1268-A1-R1_Chr7-1g09041 protein n=1 Tax=Microbotryum saponariae TaxID=289078 RepID=A0A2X0KVF9_9BASI|nr:BZ3501_MvSof-1269-A2-R1_Chr7-1g08745 [Microbotryum saponariae]SDA02679.1 BZ3500_MvSof-1268-A1-R1_Chr7-1g09041 [Microbotryum saponariae]